MKAAILEKIKTLVVKDIPIPHYGDDEVLVNIKEVGLCGSDVHFYNNGRIGDFIVKKPLILGHESSGIIAKIGKNVNGFKIGDRVSVEAGLPCYKCYFCKTGKYHLCNNIAFLAPPPYNGAFVEYMKYDPNFLFKVSDDVSFTEAALAEPLFVGYSYATRAEVKAGDYVCILGSGPIGLACG
ncbi:MAG: alcohol dehydrogenase catalytic domain-containing protein [Actinobacteria bacterium]|nr:alcohol dehydrogenase catalytic domain-containing protein [Actinomycetota bacterium]